MTTIVDRRAMIIERLVTLFTGFTVQLIGDPVLSPGVSITAGNVVHNRDQLPAEKVPGIILLDADETKDPRVFERPPGRALPVSPCLMRMTPEIYVVLDVRTPNNANVGEDLNTARAALLDLVLHDATLLQIVGANGQIIYGGCVTDLARNRTMRGQMGCMVTFVYPFIPNALSGA